MSDIPKKKATVVGKSKLPLCLLLTAAFAAVYFYVALPAINLHDQNFYTFFLLCVAVFCVLTLITGNYTVEDNQQALKTVWKHCKNTTRCLFVPLMLLHILPHQDLCSR